MTQRRVALLTASTVAMAAVGTLRVSTSHPWQRPIDAPAFLLVFAAALALLLPTRLLWWAVLTITALLAAYVLIGYPDGPALIVAPALVFIVTGSRSWRGGVIVGAGLLAVLGVCRTLISGPDADAAEAVLGVMAMAAAILAGELLRSQRARAKEARAREALVDRGGRLHASLEHARETHRGLGQAISTMGVRARLATVRGQAGDQRTALRDIAALAQDTLDDLGESSALTAEPREAIQAPSVTDWHRLVEGPRAEGQRVDATIDPAVRTLPPALGQAVHRIADDSLGGARRHAPGSGVRLRIEIPRTVSRSPR